MYYKYKIKNTSTMARIRVSGGYLTKNEWFYSREAIPYNPEHVVEHYVSENLFNNTVQKEFVRLDTDFDSLTKKELIEKIVEATSDYKESSLNAMRKDELVQLAKEVYSA